jgi:hypothetical protein
VGEGRLRHTGGMQIHVDHLIIVDEMIEIIHEALERVAANKEK